MDQIIASFKSWLEGQACLYEFDSNRRSLHFGMDGEHVRWRCTATATEPATLAMLSFLPLRAALPRRSACAELCLRINWNLALGHFDLDFTDGEIRYTTLAPLPGNSALTADLIQQVISAHRTVMDAFVPAFALVLFNETSPERALAARTKNSDENEPRFSLN